MSKIPLLFVDVKYTQKTVHKNILSLSALTMAKFDCSTVARFIMYMGWGCLEGVDYDFIAENAFGIQFNLENQKRLNCSTLSSTPLATGLFHKMNKQNKTLCKI